MSSQSVTEVGLRFRETPALSLNWGTNRKMTPTIREWIKQMSDHNFPFRSLDEGLEIEDVEEDDEDSEDDICEGQREIDVDPLCDWSKKNFKCEGGRKDKNGNIFGKVWISLPCGGEFR